MCRRVPGVKTLGGASHSALAGELVRRFFGVYRNARCDIRDALERVE